MIPVLGRSCSSIDVVDNLTGLIVGLGVGLIGRLAYSVGSRARPDDPQAGMENG